MSQDKALVNFDLLRVIQEESENKAIDVESMFGIVENSIRELCRQKYGAADLVVRVDRKYGSIEISRELKIVEDHEYDDNVASGENPLNLIRLSEALERNPKAVPGSVIVEHLPQISAEGLSLRGAVGAVGGMIRRVERERQYQLYSNRVGELTNGLVRKVERNYLVVDLSDSDGFLPVRNLIKGEVYKPGDRIRAYIESVNRDDKSFQITLSRAHNNFVAELFKSEIPEVYDGVIEIKKVVRDPGFRAKVAVYSADKNIDTVGSCIGIKGSRIKSIVSELGGEKIDVVNYSDDPALFVVNAMAPTEIVTVILDEEERNIELVVPDDQLSLAIGRHGQNVRLASALVGWSIDIVAEQQASDRRLSEFKKSTDNFVTALNVEEVIAQLLFAEGYSSVEDLACADIADVASIEGFDLAIASEILQRANDYIESKSKSVKQEFDTRGLDKNLLTIPNLTIEMLLTLDEQGSIKTLEDFAGLSRDELMDFKFELSGKLASEAIMFARKQLGWID